MASLTSNLRRIFGIGLVLFGFSLGGAWGQESEEPEFQTRQLTEVERARLTEILRQPLDLNALKVNLERQINDKWQAAMQLGDRHAEEELTQIALQHVPSVAVINNVARIARDRNDFARAIEFHLLALDKAAEEWKPFYMAHLANDYRLWWKHAEADEWIGKAQKALVLLQSKRMSPPQERNLWRSQRFVATILSFIEQRKGRLQQAIESAERAEVYARKTIQIQFPQDTPLIRAYITEDLGDALARKVFIYRQAGRLVDAEQALRELLRYSREVNLTAIQRSSIYASAAVLRQAQRDFAQAQRLGQKSLELYLQTGRKTNELHGRNLMIGVAVTLASQAKYEEAQAWLQRIDQSYPQPLTSERVPYPFERGYILLGNGQAEIASKLFERTVRSNLEIYGEGHYFTAQSRGMQGVALWRSNQDEWRAKAIELLEQSVGDLVHPRNAEFLDSYGYRPELRQAIISTYIEALSRTQSPRITHALGLADWLKAGSTQEALSDAAVRAAAQTQGLADLVRQEQDARNEIKGLRDYLAGQAGSARSTLPEVSAQMRERINVLEKQRQTLQSQIKANFPGYERLVRPLPPSIQEVAQALTPQEGLLFLMPEEKGVHVWVVTQNLGMPKARHHWAEMPMADLQRDISALRRPLEALGETGQVAPFPHTIALSLYRKLLAPVASDLANQSQWIVAASGPLARIPFNLLQVEAAQGNQPARWLIDQAALTHVPSLGSWLSLRTLPRNTRPTEPLLAWGDPAFKSGQIQTASNTSGVRAVRSAPAPSNDLDKDLLDNDTTYHDIPPLPETREELLQLAQALKAQPSDLIMGAKATRQSVLLASRSGLLQRKQVVVFATHGLMAGELPGLSQPALAMAANGEEIRNPLSPLLTLEDVLGLTLNSDWVVLSACNTASGDGKAEEALSGLARGFFYAGSRSLLVTHWAVESDSAKELTTRTFSHFSQQTQAPKAESLRQAILQVKADPRYGHPVFWAPYVLVGDSNR